MIQEGYHQFESNREQDENRVLTIEFGNMEILSELDIADLLRLGLDCLFIPLYSHHLGGQYHLSPGRLQ